MPTMAVLRIHTKDNVCVALKELAAGDEVSVAELSITVRQDVPFGAKLALLAIPAGGQVIKFGETIGVMTAPVASGGYVHTQNMKSNYLPTHERGAHNQGGDQ